jgi:MFS transporter, PAT family, beta-lactamase induction signal transducer AmpG
MAKNRLKTSANSPWTWIPTLYFAEGIPYVVVVTVAVIMFKRFGISNSDIALYTSWLYLPWVIKPLWSPVVDLLKTKRWWIVFMQLILGASLGGIALAIPLPGFFKISLIFFWLLAFSSATHDIAADGFYMLGLNEHQQAYFVGIRSTFYRIAMVTGQGLLIILAGFFEVTTGLPPVEVRAIANPSASKEIIFPEVGQPVQSGEKTYFAVYPEKIEFSTQNIPVEKVDSIRQVVVKYNRENHFVAVSADRNQLTAKGGEQKSLWTQWVSDPLKGFLETHFGSKKMKSGGPSEVGNVTVAAVRLLGPPVSGKEIVLNMKAGSGDNSIRLIEGERLTFNASNNNKPAYLLFQCDAKLNHPAQVIYRGTSGNLHLAWSITFFILAALFVVFALYHRFILPHPNADQAVARHGQNLLKEFFNTFGSFFRRKEIGVMLAFLLLYRVGEAQLLKMASPFMLDPRSLGGLGLTTGDVGLLYGTFGIMALTIGGISGGIAASAKGFRYWLWWMVLAINIPHLAYVYMSFAQPDNQLIIGLCVVIEQFCYGFGFTAYSLYMIYISEGKNKTAHYAIATGFMALGMMLPGMFSGWLQEIIGYHNFFVWVMLCMLPGMIPVLFIDVDPDFGKKQKE